MSHRACRIKKLDHTSKEEKIVPVTTINVNYPNVVRVHIKLVNRSIAYCIQGCKMLNSSKLLGKLQGKTLLASNY